MSDFTIVIDTREQLLWSFSQYNVDVKIDTIKTADYKIEGDDYFGIERKSMDDFIGTISSGWERFKRELQRMNDEDWVAKVIIVEGNYEGCCYNTRQEEVIPPQHNHYRITPQFIQKQIAVLTLMNVSVIFAGSPSLAAGLAFVIFKERYEEIR